MAALCSMRLGGRRFAVLVLGLATLIGGRGAPPARLHRGDAVEETRLGVDPHFVRRPERLSSHRVQCARVPLAFEVNRGQTAPEVQYLARGSGYTAFLTGSETVLAFAASPPARSHPFGFSGMADSRTAPARFSFVRHSFVGSTSSSLEGEKTCSARASYFVGNRPDLWVTDVRTYSEVHRRSVYPGIDVVYYGNQGQFEYDLLVSPGSNPGAIRIRFDGCEGMSLDESGNLLLALPEGDRLTQLCPTVYQESRHGLRAPVQCHYKIEGQGEVSLETGPYDASRALVIDPIVTFSTYLGGSAVDMGLGVTVDASGNMYLVGSTRSINFPTVTPFDSSLGGSVDLYVAKLNPSGTTLVYSTYLGGSGNEFDFDSAIVVDASGSAFISGSTASTDFPVVTPFQSVSGGDFDAFVLKLAPAGNSLLFSTYLGGSGLDLGSGLGVDSSGNVLIGGVTTSSNFPVANAFQPTLAGLSDAFVAKIGATGSSLIYSSYLGGSGDDSGGVAIGPSGEAFVGGYTGSTNFPTTPGSFQPAIGGSFDAFITKIDSTGSAIVYSSYLGGSGLDFGAGLVVDASGSAYFTGETRSSNFPVVGAVQPALAGPRDAFVVKVNPAGSALVYSTYLGGSGYDRGFGIAVDSAGSAYVTGQAPSPNFPVVNAFQPTFAGGVIDAFVTKFSPTGGSLVYSSYLGGSGSDTGRGIAVDTAGNAYVTGDTSSPDFPLASPFQGANGGVADAFLTKIGVPDTTPPTFADLSCMPAGVAQICFATITDPSGVLAASIVATLNRPDGSLFTPAPVVSLTPIANGFDASFTFTPDQNGLWKTTWGASDTVGNSGTAVHYLFIQGGGKSSNVIIDETNGPVTGLQNLSMNNVTGSGAVRLIGPVTLNGPLNLTNVVLNADLVLNNTTVTSTGKIEFVNSTLNAQVTYLNKTVSATNRYVNVTFNAPVNNDEGVIAVEIFFDQVTIANRVFLSALSGSGKVLIQNCLVNSEITIRDNDLAKDIKMQGATVDASVTIVSSTLRAQVQILGHLTSPVLIDSTTVTKPLRFGSP